MTTPNLLDMPPMGRLRKQFAGSGALGSGPITFARAPGRLDVMGGIADYSGSLVCEMPLSVAAGVAGQLRSDGKAVASSSQENAAVSVDVDALVAGEIEAIRAALGGDDAWARYVLGCIWYLAKHHAEQAAKLRGKGVTLVVDSDVPLGGGVSSSAAVEVASMIVLCDLLGVTMRPIELAAACQQVENFVVGAPCGVMDQVTSAMGRNGQLLRLLCQADDDGMPAQVVGYAPVPAGCAFVGIHSGVRHEVSGDPYTDTRVAAFMAQKILSDVGGKDLTGGHLANVNPRQYRTALRRRLPETTTGQAFLDEYGNTNDAVTMVVPDRTYNVRAAATHHVLEPQRVQQFVELLGRVGSDPDAPSSHAALVRAGRLMYASHHSYGLRANLGHAMTDHLVAMARQRGPANGFFGAKITGGGCGGTVALLIRDNDATRAAVESLRDAYTRETGRDTMLFADSGPGAFEVGVTAIKPEDA